MDIATRMNQVHAGLPKDWDMLFLGQSGADPKTRTLAQVYCRALLGTRRLLHAAYCYPTGAEPIFRPQV